MSALSDALNDANVNGWSAREISRRTNGKISHSVAADYLNGRTSNRPKEYVLAAFTEVFPKLTLQKLRELSGLQAGEEEPYQPPDEAHRLTTRQRRAVDEVIRLLADRAGGEQGGERDTAPIATARRPRRPTRRQLEQRLERARAAGADNVGDLERLIAEMDREASETERRRA